MPTGWTYSGTRPTKWPLLETIRNGLGQVEHRHLGGVLHGHEGEVIVRRDLHADRIVAVLAQVRRGHRAQDHRAGARFGVGRVDDDRALPVRRQQVLAIAGDGQALVGARDRDGPDHARSLPGLIPPHLDPVLDGHERVLAVRALPDRERRGPGLDVVALEVDGLRAGRRTGAAGAGERATGVAAAAGSAVVADQEERATADDHDQRADHGDRHRRAVPRRPAPTAGCGAGSAWTAVAAATRAAVAAVGGAARTAGLGRGVGQARPGGPPDVSRLGRRPARRRLGLIAAGLARAARRIGCAGAAGTGRRRTDGTGSSAAGSSATGGSGRGWRDRAYRAVRHRARPLVPGASPPPGPSSAGMASMTLVASSVVPGLGRRVRVSRAGDICRTGASIGRLTRTGLASPAGQLADLGRARTLQPRGGGRCCCVLARRGAAPGGGPGRRSRSPAAGAAGDAAPTPGPGRTPGAAPRRTPGSSGSGRPGALASARSNTSSTAARQVRAARELSGGGGSDTCAYITAMPSSPPERRRPGQQLEGGAGQRVLVGAAVDRVALDLLGRDVVQGAEELPGAGQPGGRRPATPCSARSRTGTRGRAGRCRAVVEQHVGRLDVAVHQARARARRPAPTPPGRRSSVARAGGSGPVPVAAASGRPRRARSAWR